MRERAMRIDEIEILLRGVDNEIEQLTGKAR